MQFDTINCKTTGCDWERIEILVESNGVEVQCSGTCGNVLRADNPDHPNYPEIPQPEPTVQELIQQALREAGVIE